MREEDVEVAIKVVVVGNGAVGKSSMIQRYCKGIFTKDYKKTIGVDFLERQISINGEDIRLMLWDTAGQEEFDAITKAYYRGDDPIRHMMLDLSIGISKVNKKKITLDAFMIMTETGAQACAIVFSTVDRDSFDSIETWKSKVEVECGNIPMVLVQNKIDLIDEAVVKPDEAESLAKKLRLKFYRTSVKEDLNVNDVFQHLSDRYLDILHNTEVEEPTTNQKSVAGLFSTGGTQAAQSSNNNSKPTSQPGGTGEIITLKPNKQRTQGKKSKFASCSILG